MFEVVVHIAENSINENMAQCTFGFYVLFNALHFDAFRAGFYFFFSSFSSFFPFSVCLCVLCALCNVYVCVSTLNGAKNHAGKHEQVPNIQSARNGTDGDRKVLSKWRTEPISACVLL